MEHDLPTGTVAELWRFPVKSMQGERVERAEFDAAGMAGDRLLAVRDLSTGKIVSAKAPKLGRALLTCRARFGDDDRVVVTVDGTEYVRGDDDAALDAALSELLDRPVSIVGAGREGEVYGSEWPELDGMALSGIELDLPMPTGSFVDVAPLHVLSTSSMRQLASLTPTTTIDVRRFRPGIVLDVPEAEGFVENDWNGQAVSVGTSTLRFGAASPRCIMTTLLQPDLDAAPEVLRTLAAHNRRDYAGFGDFACLGVYAEVRTAGTISVGDRVTPV